MQCFLTFFLPFYYQGSEVRGQRALPPSAYARLFIVWIWLSFGALRRSACRAGNQCTNARAVFMNSCIYVRRSNYYHSNNAKCCNCCNWDKTIKSQTKLNNCTIVTINSFHHTSACLCGIFFLLDYRLWWLLFRRGMTWHAECRPRQRGGIVLNWGREEERQISLGPMGHGRKRKRKERNGGRLIKIIIRYQ